MLKCYRKVKQLLFSNLQCNNLLSHQVLYTYNIQTINNMKRTGLILGLVICFSIGLVDNIHALNTYEENEVVTFKAKVDPFCMAIVKGDIDMVKKMIALGSDVNESSEGMTPLMYAARYNRVEIIKLLKQHGANVKAKDDKGNTALQFAKHSNAQEAVELLSKKA